MVFLNSVILLPCNGFGTGELQDGNTGVAAAPA
jgi:hypothetical protein